MKAFHKLDRLRAHQPPLRSRAACCGHQQVALLEAVELRARGITSFSVGPLKVASYVGILTALLAFAYAAYFLVKTLVSGDPVPGFPTLIVLISFLGGLQLMAIGILGEYVGRLFLETKRRPLYLVTNSTRPSCKHVRSVALEVSSVRPPTSRWKSDAALWWMIATARRAPGFARALSSDGTDRVPLTRITRNMAETGDWVTPWFDHGVPFWGKPPLSFWMSAASFKVMGVSEFAARLPHWLGACAIAWLFWGWLARRSRREAVIALALAIGSAALFLAAGGDDRYRPWTRHHDGDARVLAGAAG